jgi:hypothetical protein
VDNFSPIAFFIILAELIFIHMTTVYTRIKLSLQILISAMIGLEVSILPNPFIKPLVFLLLIYIALIHDIPDKCMSVLKGLYDKIKL